VPDISVIICAHNPRTDYLRQVLQGLRDQTLPLDQWQLFLIDNASREPLDSLWDLSWHACGQHFFEGELGLSAARRRGIQEALAPLLVFVDDDNVLEPNYLSEALKISREWPHLGSWGSASITPSFELPPSAHLLPYISYLALRDKQTASWSNVISCWESIPVGAGLCVRANVAARYLQFWEQSQIKITDRRGDSLLGHGDYEICFVGCTLGLGMGVFPELRLTHLIPKERVSDSYFLRLLESTRASRLMLGHKWEKTSIVHPSWLRRVLAMVKNFLVRRGFERQVYLANMRGTELALCLLADQEK
jgi:glycosyltransferase involved in cell wall biosynthesis